MSESYENKFILIPASHPFTPIIKTQKPRMSGSFKATVTGPDGQNIFVNDKGEIKIQFPWDRENKYNEYSSCWIPVAQQSGSQFYPRVGDEVSVRFLYGDPNRPIVMGSIPNKKRPLLYSPTDKINAIKTHSGHEIKFDDHSLTLKSSGDFNMLVNHHFKNTVHGNKTSTINGDQLLEALQGELNVNAHDIELRVGNNAIIMNNQGLSIQAEKIVLSIGGTLLPVARIGDNHQCPQKCGDSPHIGGPILSGSSNVLIDGAPIASVGDTLHCEGATDTIISGIASVTVNGKPIATVNSTCDHGGKITTGDSCVLAG